MPLAPFPLRLFLSLSFTLYHSVSLPLPFRRCFQWPRSWVDSVSLVLAHSLSPPRSLSCPRSLVVRAFKLATMRGFINQTEGIVIGEWLEGGVSTLAEYQPLVTVHCWPLYLGNSCFGTLPFPLSLAQGLAKSLGFIDGPRDQKAAATAVSRLLINGPLWAVFSSRLLPVARPFPASFLGAP